MNALPEFYGARAMHAFEGMISIKNELQTLEI